MKIQSLDDLFLHELQQLHHAEELFLAALPKLTSKDDNSAPITQAQGRTQRLEQAFRLIDRAPTTSTASACRAMEGILADADGILGSIEDPGAQDLAKKGAVQNGRHYLVARYTLLAALANRQGKVAVEKLLRATLDAESLSDGGEAKASSIGSRLTALFDRKG
jgi:ferritin-like metal-binding protein YciE